MTLNRSSYWTMYDGTTLRVKHMTITQIQCAKMYVEDLMRDELEDDPYIVQQCCAYSDFCNVQAESSHKVFGFFFEDWHDLFHTEIVKRLNFKLDKLSRPLNPKPVAKKQFWLVKWFKFW